MSFKDKVLLLATGYENICFKVRFNQKLCHCGFYPITPDKKCHFLNWCMLTYQPSEDHSDAGFCESLSDPKIVFS